MPIRKLLKRVKDDQLRSELENALNAKDYEENAKLSEERYRRLFESSQDGILIIDADDGKIIDINPHMQKMIGFSSDDTLGKKFNEIPSFKDIIPDENKLSQLKHENYMRCTGVPVETKQGEVILVDFISNLYNERGKTMVHANIRDITELSQANTKLKDALVRAEESDRLKSAFLANMSHEIRTPLNAIIGFSSLLYGDIEKKDKEYYLSVINKSSYTLLNLIDDIINLSIIESGELKLKLRPTSLDELLDQVHSVHELEMKPEVKLIVERPAEKHYPFISTDPERLAQILNNLIGNARKFTQQGEIRVGYKIADEKNIEFYVSDTGVGIPKNLHNVIFDRFKQNPESPIMHKGSGLGLTISKALVNLLGGTIKLESELGQGSRFSFTHPYNREEYFNPPNSEAVKETYKSLPTPTGTLLIVDDDEYSRSLIDFYLKEGAYHTIFAKNGREAVDTVNSRDDIKMVLMDMRMPVMDGYTATRKIRETRDEKILPIIAFTAHALDDDKEKCLQAGCNDYVPKPVLKPVLISKVAQYLK